jgi:predicted enzyme related to lactoylglutathione lyase
MTFHDTPWPDGTPGWVDLNVPDREKAMEFYGPLLGWDLQVGPEEYGYYTMALVDGRPVTAINQMQPDQQGMPPSWTTYLAVSDMDKIITAITEAGGEILMPPLDVLTQGTVAIAADPTGAVFGLWQAGDHVGTQVVGRPGTLAWNEVMTRDFAAAKAFYTAVFGYGIDDMSGEGFTYAVLTVDGHAVGGLGQLPEDTPAQVPSNWGVYFAVEDADASAARISELGGTVLTPPFDSPHGRLAVVTDNQGVGFCVIAPNEQSGKPEGWDGD